MKKKLSWAQSLVATAHNIQEEERQYIEVRLRDKNDKIPNDLIKLRRIVLSMVMKMLQSYLNKYRGGTSDASSSSTLIAPLFMISVDDFSHSKLAIFVVRK